MYDLPEDEDSGTADKIAGETCWEEYYSTSYYYETCVTVVGYSWENCTSNSFQIVTSQSVCKTIPSESWFIDNFPTGGGGGGGSLPYNITENTIMVQAPALPAELVWHKFLDCFSPFGNITATIYVDQPVEGTNTIVADNEDGKVGHTMINISQWQPDGEVSYTFGFYPSTIATPITPGDYGKFIDNSGRSFDISISVGEIPYGKVKGALEKLIDDGEYDWYDLDNRNCTDFALDFFGEVGYDFPDTYATWGFGGGSNPASLGEDLRDFSLTSNMTRNSNGGRAKKTKCN